MDECMCDLCVSNDDLDVLNSAKSTPVLVDSDDVTIETTMVVMVKAIDSFVRSLDDK